MAGYLRELHGVDIVRYEWQPAGEQIILKLLLGDRHLASDRTAEQLMGKAKDLSADMRVTLEASCYAIDWPSGPTPRRWVIQPTKSKRAIAHPTLPPLSQSASG